MKGATIFCRALSFGLISAGLLAGCAGSQPPIGAPGTMPQTSALAMHADGGKSWMLPEAKFENLLYVSDAANHYVGVFDYRSGKRVGEVGGFVEPFGECTDTNGNVYITDLDDAFVTEYAHGGTQPIGYFDDPYSYPVSCSVDPSSGDLAVANVSGEGKNSTGPGSLAVWYDHNSIYPDFFTDSKIQHMEGCSYDDEGNIFVDGLNSSGGFQYAEFSKGSYSFTDITVDQTISDPNALQWDGKYIAVGGFANTEPTIYRINGAGGQVISTTALPGTGKGALIQFWIQGRRINGVFVNQQQGDVSYWRYPSGRGPLKTIGKLFNALGVTVSLAQALER